LIFYVLGNILLYSADGNNLGVFTVDDKKLEKWIGIEEAAAYLGVTTVTIRNWIRKGNIPAHKIGKLWKFKPSELDKWVNSGESAI